MALNTTIYTGENAAKPNWAGLQDRLQNDALRLEAKQEAKDAQAKADMQYFLKSIGEVDRLRYTQEGFQERKKAVVDAYEQSLNDVLRKATATNFKDPNLLWQAQKLTNDASYGIQQLNAEGDAWKNDVALWQKDGGKMFSMDSYTGNVLNYDGRSPYLQNGESSRLKIRPLGLNELNAKFRVKPNSLEQQDGETVAKGGIRRTGLITYDPEYWEKNDKGEIVPLYDKQLQAVKNNVTSAQDEFSIQNIYATDSKNPKIAEEYSQYGEEAPYRYYLDNNQDSLFQRQVKTVLSNIPSSSGSGTTKLLTINPNYDPATNQTEYDFGAQPMKLSGAYRTYDPQTGQMNEGNMDFTDKNSYVVKIKYYPVNGYMRPFAVINTADKVKDVNGAILDKAEALTNIVNSGKSKTGKTVAELMGDMSAASDELKYAGYKFVIDETIVPKEDITFDPKKYNFSDFKDSYPIGKPFGNQFKIKTNTGTPKASTTTTSTNTPSNNFILPKKKTPKKK